VIFFRKGKKREERMSEEEGPAKSELSLSDLSGFLEEEKWA